MVSLIFTSVPVYGRPVAHNLSTPSSPARGTQSLSLPVGHMFRPPLWLVILGILTVSRLRICWCVPEGWRFP
jgi:hypothetical protein